MWVNKGALLLAKFIFLVPKCTKIHFTGFLELTFPHTYEAPRKLLSHPPPPSPPHTFKPPSLPPLTIKLNVDWSGMVYSSAALNRIYCNLSHWMMSNFICLNFSTLCSSSLWRIDTIIFAKFIVSEQAVHFICQAKWAVPQSESLLTGY